MARGLWKQTIPEAVSYGGRFRTCRDIEGFTTWSQVIRPVQIVGNLENRRVRRQLDHLVEGLSSDFVWVTSVPRAEASPTALTKLRA